ncbi:transposon Tf2-9 polyprotein [Trichonephila clavipes]|nr:transposon Tf2-9 polyprotein [Trichonephila clavipes]
MVPSKLQRHLVTNHPSLSTKDKSYFERSLSSKIKQVKVFEKQVCVSEKAQVASYEIAELIAVNLKPHNLSEEIILPACRKIVKTMIGGSADIDICKIPLSNDTIHRRIKDMSENIEQNTAKTLANSNFALQVDETTDITGNAQLIAFVRFIHENDIINQFLCCRELPDFTTGPPVASKDRRLSPEKLEAVKKEFKSLIAQGLDFTHCLEGKCVFSKLDLIKAYHQIAVEKSDIPKTAVITPIGLFEYNFMTFGLVNAAQTFQRFIDQVLRDLNCCCFAYIDDVFIASDNEESHLRNLELVFKRFEELNIKLNLGKCEFGRKKKNDTCLVVCDEDATKAFDTCKRSLVVVATFAHPLKNAVLLLMVDASDLAIGGVLQQATNGSIQPLAFFSRKLTPPELRYRTYDRELLAIYSSIRHFRHMVEVFPSKIDFDEMAKEQLGDVSMHSELQKFKVEAKRITLDSGSSV